MHEVLVNCLGGLSLPRKSVVRLTDRPDMTLDVCSNDIARQTEWNSINWFKRYCGYQNLSCETNTNVNTNRIHNETNVSPPTPPSPFVGVHELKTRHPLTYLPYPATPPPPPPPPPHYTHSEIYEVEMTNILN